MRMQRVVATETIRSVVTVGEQRVWKENRKAARSLYKANKKERSAKKNAYVCKIKKSTHYTSSYMYVGLGFITSIYREIKILLKV